MSNKEIKKDEKLEGGHTIESHPETLDRVPPTPPVEDAKILEARLKELKEKDVATRLAGLNLELEPLLIRFNFALGAEPYIENGQVKVRSIVVDTSK